MDVGGTLKFWHGGTFKKDKGGVIRYVGAACRTLKVDPDELCGHFLEELAKRVSGAPSVEGVYYLVPGKSLGDGLRKVSDDNEVREIGELVIKARMVELFVYHGGLSPNSGESSQRKVKTPIKKLTPKRAPLRTSPRNKVQAPPQQNILVEKGNVGSSTSFEKELNPTQDTLIIPTQTSQAPANPKSPLQTSKEGYTVTEVPEDYEWEDPRPSSPVPLANQYYSSDDEDSDAAYVPEDQSDENETSGEEFIDFDEFEEQNIYDDLDELVDLDGGESSDDEFLEAREKARGCNRDLLEIAKQLQEEAAIGKFGGEGGSNIEIAPTGDTDVGKGYVSEYDNSEVEQDTPPASDEDETVEERRSRRGDLVGVNTDFTQFQWKVGQRFPNKEQFKEAISKYAILQGRQLGVCASDKKRGERVGVRCSGGCAFRLYASWDSRRATYVVKTVEGAHTCTRNMVRNRQLKTTWLAKQLLDVFKARPHWPAKEIVETVRRAYKVIVQRGFAYKVKYWAHKMLHGSMKDHYLKVGRYLGALKKATPSSCFELVTDLAVEQFPPVFHRLFVSFEGLQTGWTQGCRKVICVDGCFLKTFLGGQLLSAIGRDGNEQMYPIAWAVTEGENNSSWEWFIQLLKRCLGLGDGTDVVMVSDQHQAIISTIKSVLPNAEHRHCARHVYASWHKSYKGDNMKLLFWNIVKADFNEAMEAMSKVSEDAAVKFRSYDPKLFCRAFFKTSSKCDVVTSNIVETFNNYIINARTKHLLHMLEDIRAAAMQRIVVKRTEAEKWVGNITPRSRLEKEKAEASNCEVIPSSATVFQVNHWLDSCVVDLSAKTCTCKKWDLTGIPCFHTCAALYFQNKEPEDYVHETMTKEYYLRAYLSVVPPCEGERHWPLVDLPLDPPPIKIGPGRPRKNRRKDPHESPKKPGKLSRHGIEMTCNICQRKGHNKRGCPNKDSIVHQPQQEPPMKRGRGRPRKDGQAPQPRQNQASVPTPTQAPNSVSHITAEPTRIGRGGKTIRGGRGSRGRGSSSNNTGRARTVEASTGSNGSNRGTGRGTARGRVPQGMGVFHAPDGRIFVNEPTQKRPRLIGQTSRAANPQGSQSSSVTTTWKP